MATKHIQNTHTTIILMRHGTPVYPRDDRRRIILYRDEPDLSHTGQVESFYMALRFPPVHEIHTSPWIRTYKTARIVAFCHKITESQIQLYEDLRDIEFASALGQPLDDVISGRLLPVPGIDETIEQLDQRVLPTYQKIFLASRGKTAVIVSHGDVIRLLVLRLVEQFQEKVSLKIHSDVSWAATNYTNPGEAWVLHFDAEDKLFDAYMLTHHDNRNPGVRFK